MNKEINISQPQIWGKNTYNNMHQCLNSFPSGRSLPRLFIPLP